MNEDIFEPASTTDILQSISDETLIDEVARRMRSNPQFHDKTCHHKGLIAAVDFIGGFGTEQAA